MEERLEHFSNKYIIYGRLIENTLPFEGYDGWMG